MGYLERIGSLIAKSSDLSYSIFMVNHMRHTRSQTGTRRSHHALTSNQVTLCEKCGNAKPKHVVCAVCGTYKGRQVVDVQKKLDKKAKKAAVSSK